MKITALLLSLLLTVSLLSSCAPANSDADVTETTPAETTTSETLGTDIIVTTPPATEQSYEPISSANVTSSRYGYYELDADEKSAYDQIVDAASRFVPIVELKTPLLKERIERVCQILYLEENQLYYAKYVKVTDIDSGLTHAIEITFLDRDEVLRQNAAVEERITQIIDKIQPWMATIDILKLFHDEVILNCDYSFDGDNRSIAYGALIDGKALCEGYARAFALLCNRQGIENLYATGTVKRPGVEDEEHMWNMVKLKGYWYNVDLTWDDPKSRPEDKLQLASDFVSYNYFLYPDYMFGKDIVLHSEYFTLPKATSMNMNYFIYYGYYARSYDEAVEIIGKKIHTAFEKKQKYVPIRFATKELYDEAEIKLFDDRYREIFNAATWPAGLKRMTRVVDKSLLSMTLILVYE